MNVKIQCFIVSIVLTFSAVSASAATHVWGNFCCNDGPDGTCGIGQSGAKAWALPAAQLFQIVNGFPFTDLIQIKGEQVGCYQYCQCSISMLRLWNFEYKNLTTSDPWVEFKRVVQWTNCMLAP